jgi:DNA-directed RNA polymerase specialized sigma24 family protein
MGNLTTTALILNRISQGDSEAANELAQHTYPVLLRWAYGRSPKSQRSAEDFLWPCVR